MAYFPKKILVGITGRNVKELKNKIIEADKFGIKEVSLFLTFLSPSEKKQIYDFLLKSKIKRIPLVHLRDDMKKEELIFLKKNFKTKYFNMHVNHFKYLKKWEGFYKKIILELHYDNDIPKGTDFKKIGGFCIDLSHFKASEERDTKEFYYILNKKNKKIFKCNHVNGYSRKKKKDLHTIRDLKNFDYLKEIPKFILGKYIAIETFNNIEEQLKFKDYISKILKI